MIKAEVINDFKKLYKEFYENLGSKYSGEIQPFFMQPGENYESATPKLLFVGKSTNGWLTNSRNVDEMFDKEFKDRIANRGDELKWVYYPPSANEGYNTNKSAFWRVIRGISDSIFSADESLLNVAWTNLHKFAPPKGNPNQELASLEEPICCKILDKEIEYLKPDFIIFLTSGFEQFYLDHIKIGEMKKFETWDKYKSFYKEHNGIVYIKSQHPQGKNEDSHCKAIEKIIQHSKRSSL